MFEHDYIIVPINENCHWFLAIICFPGLDGCRSMIGDKIVNAPEVKKKGDKSLLFLDIEIFYIFMRYYEVY